MCEIAVVDPEQAPIEALHQIAGKFHEEQGDGLGVLAVKTDGGAFTYDVYKSVKPHWQTLYSFFRRNMDDTWRFVIHGRAGTCGGVNREAAHPIAVDCQHCDFDYVIHNGSVRNHRKIRAGLTSAGHDFSTAVDTEVIAHKVSELPDTVSDHDRNTYSFKGNLNYLLFSEDGILVRTSRKYHLTDDFTMTCSYRDFEPSDDDATLGFERNRSNEWMLLTPDGDSVHAETKEKSRWGNTSTGRTTGTTGSRTRGTGAWERYEKQHQQEANTDMTDDEPDTHTVEYMELMTEYDYITAVQVAPGVIKIIDKNRDETSFVFRRDEPRLYYWYSDEEAPDNIAELEELAEEGIKFEHYDRNGHRIGMSVSDDTEQTPLVEFTDEEDSDETPEEIRHAKDATAMTVANQTDVTMEEAADIADDVMEQITANATAE